MALIPGTRYPAQTDTDADYPRGKARNAGSYQDGTGTPLEKDWLNDLFGFEQALLDAVGATPSGTPDSASASQYVDAIRSLSALRYAHYDILASPAPATNEHFRLAENPDAPNVANGFTLESDRYVVVPYGKLYLVLVTGNFTTSKTGVDTLISIKLSSQGAGLYPIGINALAYARRSADNTAHNVNLAMLGLGKPTLVGVVDHYENKIAVAATTPGGTTTAAGASLFIIRLG